MNLNIGELKVLQYRLAAKVKVSGLIKQYKDIILNSQADIIKKSSAGNIKQENVLPTTISKTFNSDKTLTKSSSIIMITSGQPINTGSDNKDDTRG